MASAQSSLLLNPASLRSSRMTSFKELSARIREGKCTANASGFTPFSQSDTHSERVCLSKPVFKMDDISCSTGMLNRHRTRELLSIVSRAAACFVVLLDMEPRRKHRGFFETII